MAEYLMIASVPEVKQGDVYTLMYANKRVVLLDKSWFEENTVEIEPGTGAALKAVAALAVAGAISGTMPSLPQDAANDEQTNAQRGEFTDAMVTAVARIAYNVAREWRKYEGLLHGALFDVASGTSQISAMERVRAIAENKRYPLDIANKALVFEDQLYRIVTAAVLAD